MVFGCCQFWVQYVNLSPSSPFYKAFFLCLTSKPEMFSSIIIRILAHFKCKLYLIKTLCLCPQTMNNIIDVCLSETRPFHVVIHFLISFTTFRGIREMSNCSRLLGPSQQNDSSKCVEHVSSASNCLWTQKKAKLI